ncbi:MAG: hypothetical protein Q9227_005441 [Pyrenula ochraceoflavens]
MAMVAASQTHSELAESLPITGYSLRNVDIKTALRIPEDDYGIEIVLSMELEDTATAKSPTWAGFSVSSVTRDSDLWTEHCAGQVKVETSEPENTEKMTNISDSRTVNANNWYRKFADIGLGYGLAFQALSEIRADADENLASAKVALKTTVGTIKGGESSYPIHPASLDALIQLGLVSCHGGQIDKAKTAYVPIHLPRLYLRNGVNESWGTATAVGELRGQRGAYAKLKLFNQAGNVILNADSLRLVRYSEAGPADGVQSKAFSSPFTRLVWKPDIRMLNDKQSRELFPPPRENVGRAKILQSIQRIASLIVVDTYYNYANREDCPSPSDELVAHFFAWIKRRVEEDETDAIVEAKKLSHAGRLQLLDALYNEAGHLVEIKMVKRLHDNMRDILYERRTGVDILLQDGLLTALYDSGLFMTGAYPQLARVFDCLGHANPNLSILELGAGTGGATRVAMKALEGPNGIKRYSEYTFTDVTAGFLTSAKQNMSECRDVRFSVCDIEQDPSIQGYEPAYDVVMASQTLHATASISRTLEHCRKLLKPGGKLVLVENTQNSNLVGLMLGTLKGYWHGIPDGRPDGPFLSLNAWDSALRKAGFSGTELVLDDYPHPHSTTTTLVSTLVGHEAIREGMSSNKANTKVQLLHGASGVPSLLSNLAEEMKRRGVSCKAVPLDNAEDAVSSGSRVVVFFDSNDLLLDVDEQRIRIFQHLVRSTASMVCLTSSGFVKGCSPDGSLIAGLLRTIGTENPAGRFLSIDIDSENFNTQNDDLIRCITEQELKLQQKTKDESEDCEFTWQDGAMWVSRLVPDTSLQHYAEAKTPATEMLPLDSQGPVRAAFETPGILSSLYFRPYTELWQPLPHDSIEVKVAAVGLNWKDLGLSSGHFDGNNLSSEYSGIVTKKGSSVTHLSVGDRVYGMGKGHFGSYTRVPAAFAQKLRPSDDLMEAATMPLVYMTAVYAFEYVTQVRTGQRVLIQSATGGLGLAAIQIAQSKGAEVFATAGTPDKLRFLVETMNIAASHVFSSRNVSALSQTVATTTAGRGFDVILSTGRSDMLSASLKALAPLGHLIDVGRMDVLDAKTIGLELFQKSSNFSSFDLYLVLDNDPVLGGNLMQAVNDRYQKGNITPIRPFTSTDVSQLDKTLLNFSKGTHIGKLIVSFQNPGSLVKMVPAVPAARFDPEARYIVTGGLGALGRSIIKWMCDRGAQDLVVLSRNGADTAEAEKFIQNLAARNVVVRAVACDVSKLNQVKPIIEEASADRQIKGVVHAAVSYQDLSFEKVSAEKWRESLAAKVYGTKNLHEATLSLPLDFFVMTTSYESILALATQSAYTAANNFQDYFARYRRRLGLPASTGMFGLINDLGALSTDNTTVGMFERAKALTISEHQFLKVLEPAFLNNEPSQHDTPQWVGQQHDPFSAATFVTCFSPASMAAKKRGEAGGSSSSPRWYSDARVSQIMRAYEDALRHTDSSASAPNVESDVRAILRRDFDDAVEKLKSSSTESEARGETVTLVVKGITTAMAELLFIEASGVNPARAVADHGVDSLIAAELRNWFHVALGADLSVLDLLDARTSINELAEKIVDRAIEGE